MDHVIGAVIPSRLPRWLVASDSPGEASRSSTVRAPREIPLAGHLPPSNAAQQPAPTVVADVVVDIYPWACPGAPIVSAELERSSFPSSFLILSFSLKPSMNTLNSSCSWCVRNTQPVAAGVSCIRACGVVESRPPSPSAATLPAYTHTSTCGPQHIPAQRTIYSIRWWHAPTRPGVRYDGTRRLGASAKGTMPSR